MTIFIWVIVGTLLFSGSFWLSIRIIDGENSANTFGLALFIGAGVTVFGLIAGPGGLGMIPLIGVAYLMIQHYDIGLIKTVVILAVCTSLMKLGGHIFGLVISA